MPVGLPLVLGTIDQVDVARATGGAHPDDGLPIVVVNATRARDRHPALRREIDGDVPHVRRAYGDTDIPVRADQRDPRARSGPDVQLCWAGLAGQELRQVLRRREDGQLPSRVLLGVVKHPLTRVTPVIPVPTVSEQGAERGIPGVRPIPTIRFGEQFRLEERVEPAPQRGPVPRHAGQGFQVGIPWQTERATKRPRLHLGIRRAARAPARDLTVHDEPAKLAKLDIVGEGILGVILEPCPLEPLNPIVLTILQHRRDDVAEGPTENRQATILLVELGKAPSHREASDRISEVRGENHLSRSLGRLEELHCSQGEKSGNQSLAAQSLVLTSQLSNHSTNPPISPPVAIHPHRWYRWSQ